VVVIAVQNARCFSLVAVPALVTYPRTGHRQLTDQQLPCMCPTVAPPLSKDLNSRLVQLTQSWLGVPYLFGGCSRGPVGCSCLSEKRVRRGGHTPAAYCSRSVPRRPLRLLILTQAIWCSSRIPTGQACRTRGIYIGDGLQIDAPPTRQGSTRCIRVHWIMWRIPGGRRAVQNVSNPRRHRSSHTRGANRAQ